MGVQRAAVAAPGIAAEILLAKPKDWSGKPGFSVRRVSAAN
jgi:hypothetical protein